ncbi:MAG: hypothetical protein J0M05_08355 [Candidatus Kapabacteria bacterium]|nr:hypothetical protein [Candidatus Kapabacteria bacterium]
MIKNLISKAPWQAVKNSSWGTVHQESFGNRSGYVICYNNKHLELSALATVIGQPFVPQSEIDANAALIAAAPELFGIVEQLTNVTTTDEFDELLEKAEQILHQLNSIKPSKELSLL